MRTKFILSLLMGGALPAGAALFGSGPINGLIPDNDPDGYVSTINVSGAGAQLQSLQVQINVSGGYNGDLYAYLVHNGQIVRLLNRVGTGPGSAYGYPDTGFNLTLSDDGAAGLHLYQANGAQFNGDGQLTGTWQPDSGGVTLGGAYQNGDPNGAWSLFIADLAAGDQSTLVSWSLNITNVPESSNLVVSSLNPAGYGSSITFTSIVTALNPADGTPTGAVQFTDNGAALGSPVTLDGNGLATFSTASLTVGVHTLTSEYAGDGRFRGSTNTLAGGQVVTARTLTVDSATVSPKPYDGSTAALITGTLDGVVAGDDVTLIGTGTFASRNAGSGIAVTSTSTLAGAQAGNYTLTQPTGLAGTIMARPLAVSATGINKIYDGTTAASVSLSDNRIADDVLTAGYTNATFADKNVGAAKAIGVSGISLTGPDAPNYIANTTASATANITVRELVIVSGLSADNKVYDGTNTATLSSNAVTLAIVASGDAVDLSTNGYAAAFASADASSDIAVIATGLSLTGADAGNYVLSSPTNLTANITAKGLTVTGITASNKVYDGTNIAALNPAGATLVGVLSDDDVTLNATNVAGAFADKNVGVGKTVTVSGLTLDGAKAGDYALTQPVTTADITPLALTVTAAPNTKVYDGNPSAAALPTFAPALAGADTPNFTEAYDDGNAGTGKTLTPAGSVTDANSGNNYSYTFVSQTTGTILPASPGGALFSSENPSGYRDPVAFTLQLPADASGSVVFEADGVALSTNPVSGGSAVSASLNNLPRGTVPIAAIYSGDNNYFSNTNQLSQVVTNHPPVAGASFTLGAVVGIPSTVAIVGGKYPPTDPDNDSLTLTSVTGATNGTVSFSASSLTYTATNGTADSLTYTVSDGFGGTASQTIGVTVIPAGEGYNRLSLVTLGNGTNVLTFLGVPGNAYALDLATNLDAPVNWMPQLTNTAATNGFLIFTNVTPWSPSFYRTHYVP